MEVCALDIIKGFYKQLEFIECMHSKSKRTKEDYDYDGKKCMSKFYCLHERVIKCMNSKDGNYLLHRAGRETESL